MGRISDSVQTKTNSAPSRPGFTEAEAWRWPSVKAALLGCAHKRRCPQGRVQDTITVPFGTHPALRAPLQGGELYVSGRCRFSIG